MSIETPASRKSTSGRVSASLPQVKVRRDAYVSDLEGFPLEALESRKQEYRNSSGDLPKVVRASLSFPTPL